MQIAPLLDEALAGLAEMDRNALILRYFTHCSLAEVGQRLGVTAAAKPAQKPKPKASPAKPVAASVTVDRGPLCNAAAGHARQRRAG